MQLGPMTMAACEESSFAPEMSQMFGPVQDYRIEEDDTMLVMVWVAGGPLDYFRDASAAAPGEEEIQSIPADAIQIDLNGLAETFSWEVLPGCQFPPDLAGRVSHLISS